MFTLAVAAGSGLNDPILWIAAGLAIAVTIALLIRSILRRRSRSPLPAAPQPETMPAEGLLPSADGPQLLVRGVRMRAVVVVIAPVGRGNQPPDAARLPAVLDQAVPGLARVLTAQSPRIKLWPPQLSVNGFAQAFFAQFRLPGDRGKGTPWCALAGKFEADGRTLLLGLTLSAATPNGLSQAMVENEAEWTRWLEVRDTA